MLTLGAIAFQGERLFHIEGGLKIFATRNFGFTGGYRAVRYPVEKNDDFVLVRTHGPFFGGVFDSEVLKGMECRYGCIKFHHQ